MAAPVNPTTNGARAGHGSAFEPGPDSPSDLAIGSFSDEAPWIVDPAAMTWRRPVDAVRWVTRRSVPELVGAPPVPVGHAGVHRGPPPRARPSACGPPVPAAGAAASPRPTSPAGCASPPSTSARPTSSWARSSRRARASSPTSWSTSSRSAATRCRPSRSPTSGRSSRPSWAGRSTTVFASLRPPPARRRVDRPGPRRHPASPASEVVVKVQRPRSADAGPRRPPGHGLAGAVPRRPHPGRRAGQPAGAGRAVRRDHHRGARLPARGPEHARRRRDLRRARPAGLRHPPPPPHAGHPPGAGDGAPRRLRASTTSAGMQRRRHRHRGGRAHRHDRLPRGRA